MKTELKELKELVAAIIANNFAEEGTFEARAPQLGLEGLDDGGCI